MRAFAGHLGGADRPAVAEALIDDRLERGDRDVLAIFVADDAEQVLVEDAEQASGRARHETGGGPKRELLLPSRLATCREQGHRADAEAAPVAVEGHEVEQCGVGQSGVHARAVGDRRRGEARDVAEAERFERDRRAELEHVPVIVRAVQVERPEVLKLKRHQRGGRVARGMLKALSAPVLLRARWTSRGHDGAQKKLDNAKLSPGSGQM